MYLGVVIFKNNLTEDEYNNYLTLFCAVTVCSSNKYRAFLPKARELYIEYIEEYILLYGIDSISSNLHNLCHVVDDVEQHGSLDTISSYQFENKLHHLKKFLKQCNKPLEQAARRLSEISYSIRKDPFSTDSQIPQLKYPFTLSGANGTDSIVFKEISLQYFMLSSRRSGDRYFLTKSQEIVYFEYAFQHHGHHFIHGSPLKSKDDFFTVPFSSHFLNIYKSDCVKNDARNYDLHSIEAKYFCLTSEGNYNVFIPLIHTLH